VNIAVPSPSAGLEVLQEGGGHGLGNALYLDRARGELLKVYRPRRAKSQAWRELVHSLGHQLFEGKRGTSPRRRQATELDSLRTWIAHRFDVPALIDRPIPEGIPEFSTWMEYCPGQTLDEYLRSPELDSMELEATVERLAVDQALRHRRALDSQENLLLQEHASIVHVLVSDERLMTIDFENAYRAGFPTAIALSHELAGTLRSFFRRVPDRGQACFDHYVGAYPERDLLRDAALQATKGRGISASLKRWRDQKRKNRPSKLEVMRQVLQSLS